VEGGLEKGGKASGKDKGDGSGKKIGRGIILIVRINRLKKKVYCGKWGKRGNDAGEGP